MQARDLCGGERAVQYPEAGAYSSTLELNLSPPVHRRGKLEQLQDACVS